MNLFLAKLLTEELSFTITHSFKQQNYHQLSCQIWTCPNYMIHLVDDSAWQLKPSPILHFKVVCLVAKPLNRSEAKVDLVMIQTLLLFQMQITLLTCLLDTSLYHNIVTFSLAPNQRLGNKVLNCKMAYYHDRLNRATSQLTFCTLSGGCNPWFVYLYKISPIKSCTQALPVQVEK